MPCGSEERENPHHWDSIGGECNARSGRRRWQTADAGSGFLGQRNAGKRKRSIKVTLRQLAVFEAIARCGSIAKAADEIALSQSAASMALRDLEYHLNVELFSREGGRLLLSDHGRLVQSRAAALLRQAEELERLAPNDQLVERLRLGATPSLAYSTVAEVCARFTALHTGVTIDLSVGPSTDIIGKVHRMSLDIGFIGCPNNRSDIEKRGWVDDPLAVFCAPDHPLARKVGAPLAEFLNEPWVLERAHSSERLVADDGSPQVFEFPAHCLRVRQY